jgi:hypothetical protein
MGQVEVPEMEGRKQRAMAIVRGSEMTSGLRTTLGAEKPGS